MGTLQTNFPNLIEEAAKFVAHDGHEHAVRMALALCERAGKSGKASQLAAAWLSSTGERRERMLAQLRLAEDEHLPSIQDQMAQVAANPKGFLGPFTFLASEACRFMGLGHHAGVELMKKIDEELGGIQGTAEETARRAGARRPKTKPENKPEPSGS